MGQLRRLAALADRIDQRVGQFARQDCEPVERQFLLCLQWRDGGAQVFFREGNELSRTLACSIQTALNRMPECVRTSEALAGDYYVLNCSGYASVIVECGFLSNPADEALLVTEAYRRRLAETICAGTLAFLASPSSAQASFS